ncbi:hypothetical protein [Sphingomonas sp. ID0503]|uniref:hypothetical protein n=1 Tax=Sphingomonas sp. ID0503 TaxID=3399691 RepID=UPI003AFA4E70
MNSMSSFAAAASSRSIVLSVLDSMLAQVEYSRSEGRIPAMFVIRPGDIQALKGEVAGQSVTWNQGVPDAFVGVPIEIDTVGTAEPHLLCADDIDLV